MSRLLLQSLPNTEQPDEFTAELSPQFFRRGGIAVTGRRIFGARNQKFATPNGVTVEIVSGKAGRGLKTDGGTGNYWDVGVQPKVSIDGATWVVVFSSLSTGGPNTIGGTVDSATSYIEDLWINSSGESLSAGSLEFAVRDSAGNFRRGATGNIGINDGRVHCVVWQVATATSFECWVDGAKRSLSYDQTGTLTSSSGDTEFPIWLCTRNLRGTGQFGSDATQRIYLYARIPLRIPDASQLSADPWSLFEALPSPVWTTVAAGGSFNAAWNVAANTVLTTGARAA